MTQRERAEVAAKACGVALLVRAVDALPVAWDSLPFSVRLSGQALLGSLYSVLRPVALALSGALCIWKGRVLSKRLLWADGPPLSLPDHLVRAAIRLLGVLLLLSLAAQVAFFAPALSGADAPLGYLISSLVLLAGMGAFFVFRAPQVAALLERLARGGPHSLAAAGVLLLAARQVMRGGVQAAQVLAMTVAGQPLLDPYPAEAVQAWRAGTTVGGFAALGLGLAAARYADWLAGRYAGADEEKAGEPAFKGLSGATVMTGVLSIGMAWLLLHHLDRFFGRTYWDPLEPPSSPLSALKAVAQVALVVAAFWGAGFSLPGLGSRLDGSTSQGEDDGRNLAVFVEVGLAVLSLHYLVNWVSVAIQYAYVLVPGFASALPGDRLPLTSFAVPLTLFVFRADLARMVVRASWPAAEVPREARAVALRPWLVLLGLYMLLRDVPLLTGWAARLLATGRHFWTTQLPAPRLLFGLALLLASAPLSRALSYGPFLRRGLHPSADTL